MKTINVLGVKIKDFPLKELLMKSSDFMSTPGVQTLSWLSANILLSVSENPEQTDWINDLDLMICDQAGILKSGRAASQLHMDGKSQDFMVNYLNYLAHSKAPIVLVSDDDNRMRQFKKMLRLRNNKLHIIDDFTIKDLSMMDDLFNDLNESFPRLVFTCVSWTMQGPLLDEARRMSSASMWVSFLPEMVAEMQGDKSAKNEGFFERFLFGRRVASYEKGANKLEK